MFHCDYNDLTSWLEDLLQHLTCDGLPQTKRESEEALGVHEEQLVVFRRIFILFPTYHDS